MNLTDISTIKTLCAAHGFSLSKEFGQNFIVNPGICPKIAEAAGIDERFGVLEVGPGVGVLTKELARRAKKVVAVEVDKRLPPLLAETLAEYENVTVVEGDVLKVDLAALIRDEFPGLRVAVCANLPYYITSPIVMKLLEERLPIEHITVMVQKEAADRLSAAPGTRAAGRCHICGALLRRAPHAVYRTAGQLLSPAQGNERRHSAASARSAAGHAPQRGSDVPCHPRRVQPAAQDGGQRGQRGAASAQGGGGRGAGCGRRAAHGPARAADAAELRRRFRRAVCVSVTGLSC